MSRIHEALKKAEQERAATQGGGALPGFAASPVAEHPLVDNAPIGPTGAEANLLRNPGMPVFASSFSLDALLAGSAQSEWTPDPATMLFLNGDDSARGAEEFRTLRSRLYHARGDLRGPRLHVMLGTSSSPGLSEYLRGENDEFSIMQRGPFENLFFIPSGREIGNAAELVGNGRLKALLQRVEPLFDWIIIDSPPVIPVSDASVLAKACDGVLMVVRSNSTPFDLARKARQEFPAEMLVGVVLNGTHDEAVPYSRYYYAPYEKKETAIKS
jgi:hypothetical protein